MGSVIVLDNHRAHYKQSVLDMLQDQGAELLFLPPATSIMNPIETLWAIIKRRWRQELVTTNVDKVGQIWM